ncbi:MAG: class I SAM-dependent methyltransferase [Chitinispirillales bacterium]|jgi:SAM-dependent methyltransferase|nr:class I SAM-dependent methyltransferase [Chitinispirillales bacterium]
MRTPLPITQNDTNNKSTGFGLPDDENVLRHPWYLSRRECVLSVLKNRKLHNLADIGARHTFYTKKLKTFVDENIYAVDILFPEGCVIENGIKYLNDINKLPQNELDCMVMMDVLEHIEDDAAFFNTAADKLKSGGAILITVPAFQFLFSAHDVRARHYRRYGRKQLINLLKRRDIKVECCHYFYTTLFLSCLLSFLKKEKSDYKSNKWNYSENHFLTIFIKTILNLDFAINRILDKIFIRLPGLSLIAVCKKI